MRIFVFATMSVVIASLSFATTVHAQVRLSNPTIVHQQRAVAASEPAPNSASRAQLATEAMQEASERADRLREAQRRVDELRDELAEAERSQSDWDQFGDWLTGADDGQQQSSSWVICRTCDLQSAANFSADNQ